MHVCVFNRPTFKGLKRNVVIERIIFCSKERLLFIIVDFGLTNRSVQSYSTDVILGLVTKAPAKHDAG